MNIRQFFQKTQSFEFDSPYNASECAYHISNIQHYTEFDKNEDGTIKFYVWHKFWRGVTVELEMKITPIDKSNCRISGFASNNLSSFWKLLLIFALIPSLMGLMVKAELFSLLLPFFVVFGIWDVNVVNRNNLIKLIKTTTGAV